MIELTHRPTVNEFLSHPDCADFWNELGGFFELPHFYMFLYESGCMIVVEPLPFGESLCGVHMACLKKSRGRKAVDFAKRGLKYIKDETGNRIFARIQAGRREVIAMATLSGMKEFNKNETHVFLEAVQCP